MFRFRKAALGAVVPAALAAFALPAAAQASVVGLSNGQLQYFQTTDQPNSVVMRNVGNTLRVENSTGITSFPSACQRVLAEVISCPAGQVVRAFVQLGNGNDFYTSNTHVPTEVFGLAGNDTYAGAVTSLINQVDFNGGAGSDTATYLLSNRGVNVTKDLVANDGRSGLDRDNIRNDVERITGSNFRDLLTGHDNPDTELFAPGLGDDNVDGRGGPDSYLSEATADGADFVRGGAGIDRVSYTKRTRPVNLTPGIAAPGATFADDGEAGERDQIGTDNEVLIGGQAGDTVGVRPDTTTAVSLFGGDGVDTLEGAEGPDQLHGGSGGDTLLAKGGDDRVEAADGQGDIIGCGFGTDTAFIDNLDGFSNCENRTAVGKLRLTPKVLRAEAGEPVRMRLAWRHPKAWKQLRTIELRLIQDGLPVGEVTIRPRGRRVADDGVMAVKRVRIATRGKSVIAKLGVRLDRSLAGQTLQAEVEATDVRGARQLERDAATVRVAA
jgi:Ca2+-binding RTX toxin-like protein